MRHPDLQPPPPLSLLPLLCKLPPAEAREDGSGRAALLLPLAGGRDCYRRVGGARCGTGRGSGGEPSLIPLAGSGMVAP